MTLDDLDAFLDANQRVSWKAVKKNGTIVEPVDSLEEATGLAFRVAGFAWYDNHPDNLTYITMAGLDALPVGELWGKLTAGLDVEHITRITGYFTKVHQWNPGKRAELADRYRNPGFLPAG